MEDEDVFSHTLAYPGSILYPTFIRYTRIFCGQNPLNSELHETERQCCTIDTFGLSYVTLRSYVQDTVNLTFPFHPINKRFKPQHAEIIDP